MNIEALGELTSKSIIPPWFKWVALAIAIIAIVLGIYTYGQQQYQRGHTAGADAATTKWQSKDNTELIAANAKIIELQNQAREDEAASRARIQNTVTEYQEKQTNEKAKSDVVIRDLAAGNAKLQFALKTARATTTSQVSGSDTSAAGPCATGSDEETTGELPPAIAADLYAEADRADEITEQLGLCQALVLEDRRVCGVKQVNQE